MGYCYDHAIPHSRFLDWDPDDRAKVMAYYIWKSEICPHCNTRNSDWVDEHNRFLDNPTYEMTTIKCFGCAEMERMRESLPSGLNGVYVVPVRYDPNAEPEIARREREARQREKEIHLPDGGLFS
jgi:RNase P subunit RPR2